MLVAGLLSTMEEALEIKQIIGIATIGIHVRTLTEQREQRKLKRIEYKKAVQRRKELDAKINKKDNLH